MGRPGTDERQRRMVRASLAGVAIDEFRPDVEGLRAVAVIAVVLFHVRLSSFSGGFVGVDVFFVLSGFLITRLLLRELASTGSISLPRFWARRARRLLPASCLVVIVTVIAGRLMLPPVAAHPLGVDALAAGGFVINFVFAHRLGDYFGSQLGQVSPSPLLHFWSLAVEEQFYLFWPAMMLLATRRARQYQRFVVAIIIVVGAASFAASAWLTDHRPTWAFYLLPARMGELLAGAILAMAGGAFRTVSAHGRAAAAWWGLFGIIVAVLTYDESTSFPGTATLLPVLGTMLVIIGGGGGSSRFGPLLVLDRRPLLWVGRHSYAIYLWHWPALVLAEAKFGPLSVAQRLVAVAVSVGLAALSLKLVEDPARHSTWLAQRPSRGLLMGATLCLALLLTGWVSLAADPRLDSGVAAAAPTLPPLDAPSTTASVTVPGGTIPPVASTSVPNTLTELAGGDLATLVAANRVVLQQGLATQNVPSNLRPNLAKIFDDRPAVYPDGCVAIGVDESLKPCRYGKVSSSTKVVLYGDSHAAQWFPALEQIAIARGFQLIVLTKGGCPTAAVSIPTATLSRTCPRWRDKAIAFITAEHPDLVIVTASSHYPNSDDEWSTGLDATVARLTPVADNVVVLGDNPGAKDDPASCLSSHLRSAAACTSTREHATAADRVDVERAVASRRGATFVDTTDWFCTDTGCPLIIGDIMIFRDINHITTVAALWLRPLLDVAIFSHVRLR